MHLKQLSTSAAIASDLCVWLADSWAHRSPGNLAAYTVSTPAALNEEIALIPCLGPMMLAEFFSIFLHIICLGVNIAEYIDVLALAH